ncbi:MAG: hypothetical protein HKN16_00990 [Saprospiraceae bacterium]|nr:hypothetical protein [Saprospiraceae bacterium]
MKKFKQLALSCLLLSGLILFGSNSLSAQTYVSQSEAMTLLDQEITAMKASPGKQGAASGQTLAPAMTSPAGPIVERAKRILYASIYEILKTGEQNVGTAISSAYNGMLDNFNGSAARTSYLNDAENAAQDLLQI